MFVIVGGAAGAALGTAAIGAGAAIYSANKASSASKAASQAQTKSADKATQAQLEMYYQSREDLLPWLEAGKRSLASLEDMVSSGPGKFEESPYYEQNLDQANKATNAFLASRGLYASGSAGKALQENAVRLNAQNRGNWLNEWIATKLNPTQSLAGVGQTAATNLGGQSLQTGQNIAQNELYAGGARASGIINQSNALTQGIQGAGNVLGSAVGQLDFGRQSPGTTVQAYQQGPGNAPTPNAWWDGYEWVS